MGLLEYADGRTGLTTTAFRYRITQADGTLVKDWTTGATWTESPAGTYTLTDAAGLAGMRYEVEPATGEVGAVGDWYVAAVDAKADTLLARATEARLAELDAANLPAAKDEIIAAIAGEYAGDTLITDATRIDASGNIVAAPAGTALGVAAAGSTMQAFLASDVARENALRRSVAAADGTWALSVPTGTLVIRESQDGFYDATEGDSVIEITVVIP
jgi:hypothetical protein